MRLPSKVGFISISEIICGKEVVLYSPLSVDECHSRLRRAISVIRSINDDTFVLRNYDKMYANSFAPLYFGTLVPAVGREGTVIQGRFDMTLFVKISTAVWLLGVIILGGVMLIDSLIQFQPVHYSFFEDIILPMIVPTVLLAFGAMGVMFGRWLGTRNDEPFLLDLLKRTLEATEEPS